MNSLTADSIALDTNIFEHLFNPLENTQGHIDDLLGRLRTDEIRLLIDDAGPGGNSEIESEYERVLGPRFKIENDTDERLPLLRYWIVDAPRQEVPLDLRGQLFQAIKPILRDRVDRVFVMLVFAMGRVLVTNDRTTILHGAPHTPRSKSLHRRLMNATRKWRDKGADLVDSQEAWRRIE